jgi:hypothetical protein
VLRSPARARAIGVAARERVRAVYGWDSQLAGIDRYLGAASVEGALR